MNNEYISKDIGEVAVLILNGCDFRSIQWKGPTAYFVFRDPKKCAEFSRSYFYGELTVSARAFSDTLRMVKRKLYETDNGGKRR